MILGFVVYSSLLLVLLNIGLDKAAGYALMLFIPLMITYLILNGTGLNDPGILGYSATVVSASLLFGRRSVVVFSAINAIQVFGVYLMENYGHHLGWVRPTPEPSNFFDLVVVEVLLLVSSVIFWVIIGRITRQADRLEELVRKRTTQLEKNNRELKRAQTELIRKERMASLGGLVAGVAHEVNTPIGIGVTASTYLQTTANRFTHDLDAGDASGDRIVQFVRDAKESADLIFSSLGRAQTLIQSFKQLAVDQTSELRRCFELPGYVDDIMASLASEIKPARVSVSVECPEKFEFDSYPGLFYQIFTNLVFNSLIHGFAGRGDGNITITILRKDEDLRIEYRDDGVGVPPDLAVRIFEPFYTSRPGKGGSGLGLSTVYNIITQNLGGEIEAIIEPGEGLGFLITIPGPVVPAS